MTDGRDRDETAPDLVGVVLDALDDFINEPPPPEPPKPPPKKRGGRPPGGKFRVPSDGLFLGSLPLQCPEALGFEEVERRQRVKCRRRTNCLTYAASMGWSGFDCRDCAIEEELSLDEQRRDLEGLAAFLRALNLRG
jgi:hypothetical protein